MITVGCSSVCCSSTTESRLKLSRKGAGHGDPVEPGELVGDEVVERHPALLAIVARVRPRMDRADRNHEAQPVSRGHVTTAPGAGERDVVMGRDQEGV